MKDEEEYKKRFNQLNKLRKDELIDMVIGVEVAIRDQVGDRN